MIVFYKIKISEFESNPFYHPSKMMRWFFNSGEGQIMS